MIHSMATVSKRALLRALNLAAALGIAGHAGAQTVSFSDSDFVASNWSATMIMDTCFPSDGSFVAQRVTSGGNGGAFRRVTQNYSGGSLVVGHLKAGATYTPSTQGEIGSMSCAFDIKNFSDTTWQPASYGPLLVQNNTWYTLAVPVTVLNSTWTGVALPGLQATDFLRLSGSGPLRPNFSSSGSQIRLGYYTVTTAASVYGFVRVNGIDNWSVSVGGNATCAPDCNGDGSLDVQDVLAFLAAYNLGSLTVDFDANGVVNQKDIAVFFNLYASGCN